MKIKNKTEYWQNLNGVTFRPWRDGVVPDDTPIDEKVFEILDKKKEDKKMDKKEIKQ